MARRLADAGLAWLRRRRKSCVASVYKPARLLWADWVLPHHMSTLARLAYTDGTTFFLARTEPEREDKARLALGSHVWRMADGSDGLFEECVGPSVYAKAQGRAVRMWGLLASGILFVFFLPKGQVMNRWWYAWLIEHKFPVWLAKAFGGAAVDNVFLVQDHERALWKEEPLTSMRSVGISLLRNFPKSSQDMNPIEVVWRELRARLYVTQPVHMEEREEFITRARNVVAWVNKNRQSYLN